MSSASNSGDRAPARADAQPEEVSAEPSRGPGMLEQVLAQTLSGSADSNPVDAAERAALERVVQAHRGEPFALEPIGVEFIQALLEMQFEPGVLSPSTVQDVARQIATTLFEDPASRARLDALWTRLSER